ncbi:hypothetical protein ZWY2020_023120 [Hordeum vulgare]|nr:hypothetical protein ZWY2020_023120 [Hordeum vulgare]
MRIRAARPDEADAHRCDVRHDAPALVMTAGGYTGSLFHAFNDGFLPAWLTVQHLRRRVVLAVLAYKPWEAQLTSECAAMNACDVLAGVDGADLTKLLFLRPGCTAVLQVAPLGMPRVARGCYEKAMNMMRMQYE